MTAQPRRYADFRSALKASFEEEISGAAFFAGLGDAFDGRAADVMRIFVEIEHLTEQAIAPLAARYGLPETPRERLVAEGREEAAHTAEMGWAAFLDDVIVNYPVFITEFQELVDAAAPDDRPVLALLIDHEQALLDFAAAERRGDPDSLAPLHAYISRLQTHA